MYLFKYVQKNWPRSVLKLEKNFRPRVISIFIQIKKANGKANIYILQKLYASEAYIIWADGNIKL